MVFVLLETHLFTDLDQGAIQHHVDIHLETRVLDNLPVSPPSNMILSRMDSEEYMNIRSNVHIPTTHLDPRALRAMRCGSDVTVISRRSLWIVLSVITASSQRAKAKDY